jgi:hypothetical protein
MNRRDRNNLIELEAIQIPSSEAPTAQPVNLVNSTHLTGQIRGRTQSNKRKGIRRVSPYCSWTCEEPEPSASPLSVRRRRWRPQSVARRRGAGRSGQRWRGRGCGDAEQEERTLKISATPCGRRSGGTQKDPPGTKGSQSGVARRTMTPWMASSRRRIPFTSTDKEAVGRRRKPLGHPRWGRSR